MDSNQGRKKGIKPKHSQLCHWKKYFRPALNSREQGGLKDVNEPLTFSVMRSKRTVYKCINDGVFLRLTNKALPMGRKKKTE